MAKKSSAPVAEPVVSAPVVASAPVQESQNGPQIPENSAKPRRENLLKQELRKQEEETMQATLEKVYSPEEKADAEFLEEFDKVKSGDTTDEIEQESVSDNEIEEEQTEEVDETDQDEDEIDDEIVQNPYDWITSQVMEVGTARGFSGAEIAEFGGLQGFITACKAIDRRAATQQPESKKADTETQFELPPELAEELNATFGDDHAPLLQKALKAQRDGLTSVFKKEIDSLSATLNQFVEVQKRQQADKQFEEFDGMFDVLSKQSPSVATIFGKGIAGKDLLPTSKAAQKQIQKRAEAQEAFDLLLAKNPTTDRLKLLNRACQIVDSAATTSTQPRRTIGRAATKTPAYSPQQKGRNPKEDQAAKDAEYERQIAALQKAK